MKYKILSFALGLMVIALLIFTGTTTQTVSYHDYRLKVENINTGFIPDGFISINKTPEAPYAKVNSYPGHEWTGENSNYYGNNVLDAKQIESYFLIQGKENILSKITFFYAPDSRTRDYLKVDYLDVLEYPSVIEAPYVKLRVIPHYEVAFKGKGYNVFVQSTFYEEYYRNTQLTEDDRKALININADLVRKLQEYLINNQL